MRILFLIPRGFIPQRVDGAVWSTHILCQELQKRGDSVGAFCALSNKGWLAIVNRIKRKLTGVKFPSDTIMGYKIFRGWDPYIGIMEVVNVFNPEILVIVGISPNPVKLAQLALQVSLPVVFQVRHVEFEDYGGDLNSLKGVRFVSNSRFTAKRIYEQFGITSDIVLPPVMKSYCKVRSPGSKVVIINPDPKKGGHIAIKLAEMRPDIPFIFQESWLGNENLHDLKARAAKAGNVEWRKPVLDVRKIYKKARLILAPAQWEETWGRTATEAHFSGIPVIGSRIGGLEEAIGPGGLQVSPNAPINEWLQALETLWDDPSEWKTASIRSLEYSNRKEINVDYQIQLFRSILNEHCYG